VNEESVLLDTSIVSIFLKTSKIHEARRKSLEAALVGKIPLISFITVAELLFWAETRDWQQKRRTELDDRLRLCVVLQPTRFTSEIWAETKRALERNGKRLESNDLWIAASALEHDVTLYTADTDYSIVPDLKTRRL